MGKPIMSFEITCSDASRQGSFYNTLFGWEVTPTSSAEMGEIAGAGMPGRLFQPPDRVAPSLIVYVEVDDVVATLSQAGLHGGTPIFGPIELPDGSTIGMIADPEGISIGLSQRRG